VLTVSNGTQTAKITLTGNYVGHTFTVATDGHTGVLVTDPPAGGSAPLSQALAGFQTGPVAHLAITRAYCSPRLATLHAQA
jgi:hypothetical protein